MTVDWQQEKMANHPNPTMHQKNLLSIKHQKRYDRRKSKEHASLMQEFQSTKPTNSTICINETFIPNLNINILEQVDQLPH